MYLLSVLVVLISNIVSTAEVIAAAAAAMPHATLSSTKSSYRTLGDEVLAKEPGWIPDSLVHPDDERKEEVYGPRSYSSNSSDHGSSEEEKDVHCSEVVMAPVDVVAVVLEVSGAFTNVQCVVCKLIVSPFLV
jgi:hypothetical protein